MHRRYASLLGALLSARLAWALPENPQVVQGQLQVVQPQSHILQVLQSSPTGIINWSSFSIGNGQLVQFLQPDVHSAVLNRVIGQDPSQILGQLQANGQVVLVNPNGILFGPGSSVNAGSFMATTLALDDQDFLQGRYNLHLDGPMRAVVNQGEIRVTEGGFIALVSPLVENQGLLVADRGQVVLGATTQASLGVDARGLLQVVLPQAPQAPGPVMLTPEQMTDTLASLVRGPNQDSGRILETAQGIQLVGAEGLALNEGQIRAATVLVDSSKASVNSGSMEAGEIRLLSAGAAVQTGDLRADFAEVSGSRVHITRGLQGGGQLLVDPVTLHIVNSGGTLTPDILAGDGGANESVDASALDPAGGGIVRLEATSTIFLDNNVNVLLTHPNIDLRLTAPNVLMDAMSSIQATDPSDSVTISASTQADISRIQVANVHVTGGLVNLQNSQLGMNTAPTVVDLSGTRINAGGMNQIEGGSTLAANLTASDRITPSNGAQLQFSAPIAYANVTAGAGGITLNQNVVRLQGTGNLTLAANSGGPISVSNLSQVEASGAANITLRTSGGGSIDVANGAGISSNNPGSTAVLQSSGDLRLGDLLIPNVQASAQGQLNFSGALLGIPGQDLTASFTVGRFRQTSGADLTVVGATANVVIDSLTDFLLQPGSGIRLNAVRTNLTLHSDDSGTLQDNAFINAPGAANVTLSSNHGTLSFGLASSVSVSGPGNINVTNPVGAIIMSNGSDLDATDAQGSVFLRAGTDVELGNLQASRVNIDANSAFIPSSGHVLFHNSHLGVVGRDTVVNITAHNLDIPSGAQVDLQGDHAHVDVQLSNSLTMDTGSLLQVQSNQTDFNAQAGSEFRMNSGARLEDSGAGNYSIGAGFVVMDATSTIAVASPSGHVAMNSTSDGVYSNIEAAHLDLQSDNNVFFLGDHAGLAGSPTNVNVTAGVDVGFFVPQFRLDGSVVNATISAGAGLQNFSPPLLISGASPTRLELRAEALDLTSSNISFPNSGSNVSIQTHTNLVTDQIESGRIELSSGGDLTMLSPIQGDQLFLQAGGELIAQSVTPLTARHSLEVSAQHIRGPVDFAPAGLVSALPFATDNSATVRFQVTGNNDPQLGNRAANLFYAAPQSSDVQVSSPNGQTLLYREGQPLGGDSVAAAAPAPPVANGGLSPIQRAELINQSAVAQVIMSNYYDARDLISTESIDFLRYDNLGLTNYSPMSLLTPVVELVVLSPEQLYEREKSRDQRAFSVVVGDDEDEELRYWRKLIQGIIIWEDE